MAATPSARLEPRSRALLLATAAAAIESRLALRPEARPDPAALPAELAEVRASFVTLTIAGTLRGCCGSLEPRRPLALDVWSNARASAFEDPRFEPLAATEWARVDLEVSVLSPLERVTVRDEAELLARLVPGEDGVVIAWRDRRATFLPKVWEQLPGRSEFLRHLKRKAGWPEEFWAVDVEVWRYGTETVAAPCGAARSVDVG
jgi:AmmeMemoRadiSam system protein A